MSSKKVQPDKQAEVNPVPQEESKPELSQDSTLNSAQNIQETEELKKNLAEKEAAVKLLDAQIQTLRDQLLRNAAEFDNFRRRTEQERADLRKYEGESVIKNLLTISDDFERSFSALEKTPDPATFIEGIRLIAGNLSKLLDQKGVKPIECIGQTFDVNLHDALMHIEKEGVASDTIIDEVQKGYTFNGKVIRHSKVLVAR
ncbi:MAG: nucleotide exchange factor GrpE [Bacteroidetes bacterium]|nr:nucleotide exchange factor GrpE [Bacteroidota bacterium]